MRKCVKISIWKFSCYIFSLIIFVLMIILACVYIQNSIVEVESKLHEYRYLNVNLKANDSFSGFATLPFKLSKSDSSFYKNDENSLSLLSKFGTEEYKCSGFCYCDDFGRRTSPSVELVRHGMMYLLAAITYTVAYSKAKSYFETECRNRLEDSCSVSSINHEVERCENVEHAVDQEEEGNYDIEISHETYREYICKGRCVTSRKLRLEETLELGKEFDCSRLKKEVIVKIDINSEKNNNKYLNYNYMARKKFRKDHLVSFCKRSSETRQFFMFPGGQFGFRNISLCVSSNNSVSDNKSIRCVKKKKKDET